MTNASNPRARYLGTAEWRCVDGVRRTITVHSVEDAGDGSWYVTGRDSNGHQHSAYTDRQQG